MYPKQVWCYPRTEDRPLHPSTPYVILDELKKRGSPGVQERKSKEAIVVVLGLKPGLQHTSSSAEHHSQQVNSLLAQE